MFNWSYMVCHYVYHNPHAHRVSCVNQSLESGLISEVGVNLVPVASPVAVIAAISIVNGRGDPDSIEAEVLHVLQLLGHTVVVTSAVIVQITERGVSVASPKSIGEDLIHCALLPTVDISSSC
jgi:hypothetical protein